MTASVFLNLLQVERGGVWVGCVFLSFVNTEDPNPLASTVRTV